MLALADELRVPAGRYEFQMLYGMADEIKEVLVGLGHRLRVYTPFGQLLPGWPIWSGVCSKIRRTSHSCERAFATIFRRRNY